MTTSFVPTAQPLRPRAWGALVACELRSVVRDTAGLLIPLGLPALVITMYGLGGGADAAVDGTGASYLDVFGLPLAVVMVLSLIGVVNMPSFLAAYRRTGILRRLSVTPLEPLHVLMAQVVVSAVQSVVGIAIAVSIAVLGFGAELRGSVVVVVGVTLLVAAAMYGIGMVVAAVSPTPNSAVAIGMVAFFAMGATGGLFGPVENLPPAMADVGAWLPFGSGTEVLRLAWTGGTVPGPEIALLAALAAIGLLAGVLTFRWDR